ncbi:MAG: hypothetical protein KIS74_03300 [Burkholderiales bacterium]|nr:hypothetical protein [Burkholderiales bacterium]
MARLDQEQLDRHYPQLTYETGLFMVAYLRRLHAEFGGDVTAAIVLGEIAQHNVRHFMKELLPRSGKDSAALATDEVVAASIRRCNMLSIAEASGIPRETVRRKVAKLEKLGLVSRDAAGGLAVTRKVGRQFKEFDRETLAGLVELAERVRGLLRRR